MVIIDPTLGLHVYFINTMKKRMGKHRRARRNTSGIYGNVIEPKGLHISRSIITAAERAVAKRKKVAQLKAEIRREHTLIRKLRKLLSPAQMARMAGRGLSARIKL